MWNKHSLIEPKVKAITVLNNFHAMIGKVNHFTNEKSIFVAFVWPTICPYQLRLTIAFFLAQMVSSLIHQHLSVIPRDQLGRTLCKVFPFISLPFFFFPGGSLNSYCLLLRRLLPSSCSNGMECHFNESRWFSTFGVSMTSTSAWVGGRLEAIVLGWKVAPLNTQNSILITVSFTWHWHHSQRGIVELDYKNLRIFSFQFP